MKTKLFTLILILSCALLDAQTVHVKIIDEQGLPVSDAEVKVLYSDNDQAKDYDIQIKQSDQNGEATFEGEGPLGIYLWVKKEGYYSYGHRPAKEDRFMAEANETVVRNVTLRSIQNPVSLYAKINELGSKHRHKIPLVNKWVGFDFEKGDWVKPHGNGKETDILFYYHGEFVKFVDSGWSIEKLRNVNRIKIERQGRVWNEEVFRKEAGLWEGTLKIAFAEEKEGLVRVEDSFMLHNVLRMPHEAPEHGYIPEYAYERADGPVPGGSIGPDTPKKYLEPRDDIGFFLRTRVILDEDGEVESANYTKVYGDFQFSPKGFVAFDYYFNPTRNNRNLEFDPKENLFPKSVEGSNVILP